jgi:hypothetical protein
MDDNWGRFRDAAMVMAGQGPIKQRLIHACRQHLTDIEPEELPHEVRADFDRLHSAISSARAAGVRDQIEASILKMSESEAGRHGVSIVMMFAALSSRQLRAHAVRAAPPLRAVSGED